ncbi:MAG: 23S rRNA (guanosine(2251)-2'-O)-methyltransferase RlmB [Clostridiales bacterium]|nr:23S rRNA (guanosine(2251)-2'-O)-methyltransferase RlmB [Clostridiales bacterium]
MSKRDNKRFNDKERKGAPKRGGKNRRDYGEEYSYEPKKRSSSAGSRRQKAAPRSGRATHGDRAFSAKNSLLADFGYSDHEEQLNIGADGLEVVAGRNPVVEVLSGDRDVERIFIADGSEGSVSKIVALAREQGVIVDFVPKEKIDAMAPGVKHQGVVAKVSEYKYAEMEDVFAKAEASGEDPFIIILDEISDPHNLGAIIRTAECAGAHGVVIPKRRAASLTQTVALSAAGAVENMPVVQVTNLARTIEELQAKGIWVGAADMDGETYYEANLTGPIAIVIGNEGKGVGRLVKEKCDFVLSIPMYGKTNSLNASNAAAVLMYGIRRARKK